MSSIRPEPSIASAHSYGSEMPEPRCLNMTMIAAASQQTGVTARHLDPGISHIPGRRRALAERCDCERPEFSNLDHDHDLSSASADTCIHETHQSRYLGHDCSSALAYGRERETPGSRHLACGLH